jgi:hypothetical protein
MAFLAVSMLLTNVVAVAANPGLELDQGDEITYELTELKYGYTAHDAMSYENMTGTPTTYTGTPVQNISEGDELTFELAIVTEDTMVHGIETYEPESIENVSNTYDYDASDLNSSCFYTQFVLTGLWYDFWFSLNLVYGVYYSSQNYVPWALTDDWDDHEDAWMDLLAWEQENGTFAGVADITADVDDKTFTMEAVYNASMDTAMGTTDEFDGETAYYVEVEYAGDGHAKMQKVVLRDLWAETETSEYESITMVWEEVEGMPLLYIVIPIVAVVIAVAVFLVLKK